jgi:VCBS repeat-containing protein
VAERADGAPTENGPPGHAVSGVLGFADVDGADTHAATVTPQGAGYLGSLTLAPVNQAGNTVGWTFSVPDGALDSLQAGQVLTQAYTVAVTDTHGAAATQTVSVTLTGANDAPTLVRTTPDLSNPANLLPGGGAGVGVAVTALYAPGSNVNLLEGRPPLVTSSGWAELQKIAGSPVPFTTGYNYMGTDTWFADNAVNLSGLAGGTIVFSNGITGRIDTATDGLPGERAYVYYRPYDPVPPTRPSRP